MEHGTLRLRTKVIKENYWCLQWRSRRVSSAWKANYDCWKLCLIAISICVNSVNCNLNVELKNHQSSTTSIKWTNRLALNNGFIMKWFNRDSDWFMVEMSAKTTGYVALGFSPQGGMRGSDIVVGWVDSQGGHLKDMYAVGTTTPLPDVSNDYELLHASEKNNRTKIRFRRRWNTCDKQDFHVTENTLKLIYAWNDEDPQTVDGIFKIKKHISNEQGEQSVYLKTNEVMRRDHVKPHRSVQTVELTVPDLSKSKEPECHLWNASSQNFGFNFWNETKFKGMFINGFEIIDNKGRKSYRRLFFYSCNCDCNCNANATLRNELMNDLRTCCRLVFSIGPGNDGMVFPEGIEVPFSDCLFINADSDQHCTNTTDDNLKLRLFLISKKRSKETGGVLQIGNKSSPFHVVPAQATAFTTVAFCPSSVTKNEFPKNGIFVSHVTFETNNAGRKVRLRHIRRGRELAPLVSDDNVDFNYQKPRLLSPPRRILQGDILMTECTYDTTWTFEPRVHSGDNSTSGEVCLSNIYYYPQMNLSSCLSQPELQSFLNGLGINRVKSWLNTSVSEADSLDDLDILDPQIENWTVGTVLRNADWGDTKLVKKLEQKWMKGKHTIFISKKHNETFELTTAYPKFWSYRPFSNKDECSNQERSSNRERVIRGNNRNSNHVTIWYPRLTIFGYSDPHDLLHETSSTPTRQFNEQR